MEARKTLDIWKYR